MHLYLKEYNAFKDLNLIIAYEVYFMLHSRGVVATFMSQENPTFTGPPIQYSVREIAHPSCFCLVLCITCWR